VQRPDYGSADNMNAAILRDVLHKLITVYLGDVRVYNRSLEGHMEHLRRVIQRFKEEA
jgi:hypothetical protein